MSIISECLKQILSARYGRDVRQSIHDGIKEIDSVARTAQNSATANAQTASAKASEALTASQEALEKAQEAHESAERAKVYAENAEAVTGVNIATKDTAGLVKGGENHIAEDGTLELVVKTTETTMPNSHDGRVLIDEIGGACEQFTTTGKNLLDCSNLSTSTHEGVTYTPEYDGNKLLYIEASGTSATVSIFDIARGKLTLPAGNYIANSIGCDANKRLVIYKTVNGSHSIIGSSSGSDISFTLEEDTLVWARCEIGAGQTVSKFRFYPMIRLASVTDATYEPFTNGASPNPSYPQEIKKTVVSGVKTHGKNFIKKRETSKTQKGLTLTANDDGSFTLNGTATEAASFAISTRVDVKIGESYVLSGCPSGGSEGTFKMYSETRNADNKGIKSYADYGNGSNAILTDDCEYLWVGILVWSGFTANNLVFKPMIREVGTDDTYEPYKESTITLSQPIELYGIGDVQDTIEDGKVKRRFAKVVFDGSENWKYKTSPRGTPYFCIEGTIHKPQGLCISIHFSYASSINDFDNTIRMGNADFIQIRRDSITSVNDWKTWLSENNVTAIYELAEEVTEELPIADQIALNSLATYDGITYLEFDSEIEPTFKGRYGTSLVGGIALESRQNIEVINNSLSNHSWGFVTEESGIYTEIESGYVATEDCALQVNALTGNTMNSSVVVFINGTLALARQTIKTDCPFYTTDILRLQKGDVVTSKVNDTTNSGASLGLYIRPKAQ